MKRFVTAFVLIALAGCTSNQQRNSQQEEINKTIPTCASQKQCDAAWSAARQWVTQNCGMKIQNYSPDFIETYNSLPNSSSTACQVTKNLQPNGLSTINITVRCANMFGCVPDQYESVLSFNKYVGNYVSKFSPVVIGAMMGMADKKGNVVDNKAYSAGMVVKNVQPGGIADSAGLQSGDIVTSIGAQKIRNQTDMTTSLEQYSVGDEVSFTILRLGKENKVILHL